MASIFTKKAKKSRKLAQKKSYLDLLEDAGGIPAGVYEILEESNDFILCTIAQKVLLGVQNCSRVKFRILKQVEGVEITTLENYLVSYWKLQEERKGKRHFFEPVTTCMMSQSLQGYQNVP